MLINRFCAISGILLLLAACSSRTTSREEKRFYELGGAAKASCDNGADAEAKEEAEELLALAGKYKGDWNYGNAIHDANVVLGRIALREGDVESAKQHLLAAGKTPGSPQLDSFGPNMTLARDLLRHHEKQVVLQYFEECRSFWKVDNGELDEWSKEVKADQMPSFGPNLRY